MPGLTTHVLDIVLGRPAAGIPLVLRRTGALDAITTAVTNDDGRTDAPLLETLERGTFELTFTAGAYLATHHAAATTQPQFLNEITLRFGVSDTSRHLHVPLLLAPHGYSTYRGS